jgi:hypothetical protein
MKKNSNRQVKDYSKCALNEKEYYGLLIKNGVLRIDPKRLKKTTRINNHIYEEMNKPRKTVYFIPQKINKDDYMCNIFRSTINQLKSFWVDEFKYALRAIKTPSEAKNKAYSGHFALTGILDYDEVGMYANMSALNRSYDYAFVIQSMIGQFIHQMVSTIEAVTIRVIKLQGYDKSKFNRDYFDAFVQGRKKGLKLEDIHGYLDYDKLYHVWNFLKHNSSDIYDKIKNKYPEMLYDEEYSGGELAVSVLKIDKNYITEALKKIEIFFDNLCLKVFEEDVVNADWNYNDFFIKYVNNEIEFINNPLGLPWYI